MAVALTVSQIRNALYLRQPGGSSGPGRSSTASLGTLFHQVLAGILTDKAPCSLQADLNDHDPDLNEWKAALQSRVYDQLVGPLLTQQYAALEGQGRQVLDLWIAVRQACDYLADLWWTITKDGTQNEIQGQWFEPERSISREFHRPGWTSPVAVIGQLDAVLRIPGTSHSCLLEWKLGQTSPELDLAQACLYQMLLEGELGPQHQVALAVVGFHPERHDVMFQGAQLETVRESLYRLIGDLAGVTGKVQPAAEGRGQQSPARPDRTMDHGNGLTRPPELKPQPTSITIDQQQWVDEMTSTMLKTLRNFGAPCRAMQTPVFGPAFVRFFLFPEKGITSKRVLAQADALHLHLGLASPPGIQIVDGLLAIDLPRPDRQSVRFSDVVSQLPPRDPLLGGTKIPIGVDLQGVWHWCDLAKDSSPHLLVVGTPGSGKSEWLRSALASLLLTNSPETLELVLIDPKQNAFGFAKDFPHLSMPIIVPGHEGVDVTEILRTLVERIGHRNAELSASNSKKLEDHVRAVETPQRRLVVICDEYADLLASCSTLAERRDLEQQFQRIAQVGRAPGFHLILATQRPTRNNLNTSIRALLPARVALRVTNPLESKVALDEPGAERLLGNGDLYYKCIGPKQRFQGPWLPTEEEGFVTAPSTMTTT